MRTLFLVVGTAVVACATGSGVDFETEDENRNPSGVGDTAAQSTAGQGGATVTVGAGGAPQTTGSGGCQAQEQLCGGICVDITSNAAHCGGCSMPCPTDMTCVMGVCTSSTSTVSVASSSASSSASSATVTVSSSSVSSSGVGGGGPCSPLSPATKCGSNNHCVPQPNGTPICTPPTGLGTQYTTCSTSADCAAIYDCVNTPFNTVYCLQWCSSNLDCPGYPFDLCNGLNPKVYVGAQEWGVCYDGLP